MISEEPNSLDNQGGDGHRIDRRSLLQATLGATVSGGLVSSDAVGEAKAAAGDTLGTVQLPGNDDGVAGTFTGEYYITADSLESTRLQIYDPPASGDGEATLVAEKQVVDDGNPVTISCLEWDNGREKLIAANNGGGSPVYLLDIGDPEQPTDATATLQFEANLPGFDLMDGIALDPRDGSLWLSPDVSRDVYQYTFPDGERINTITPKGRSGGPANSVSGLTFGGRVDGRPTLYIGRNGKEEIYRVFADDGAFLSQFATTGFRVEGLTPDRQTYDSSDAVLGKDAYSGKYAAYEIPELPPDPPQPPAQSFSELKNEKLALAERVTNVSLGVNDEAIAQSALGTLETNLSAGDIDERQAVEAVERLKLGENVSETTLVTTGPADTITPENESTLVGSDADTDYDIVGSLTDLLTELLATLAVLGGTIAGQVAAVLAAPIVASVNEIVGAVLAFIKVIGLTIDAFGDVLGSESIEEFGEAIKSAGEPRKVIGSGILSPIKDPIEEDIRQVIEEVRPYSVEPALLDFSDTVAGATGGSPAPEFSGTTSEAKEAANTAIDGIQSIVEEEANEFEETKLATAILDVASGLAAIGAIFFGISALLAVILQAISVIMKSFQAFSAVKSIERVIVYHSLAIEGVRTGTVVSDV